MRCIVCDASDVGLSTFRPDGYYTSHSFHTGLDGRVYCAECDDSYSEAMGDYHDSDLEREEDDGAFEFIEDGDQVSD